MTSFDACLILFSGVLGACVGSFLNVCIYRLPREDLAVDRPRRSFCPSCGHGIRWYDNIPLASWLLLGGKCRFCRAPISLRYVVVEALTAVLFVVVAARYADGLATPWAVYAVLLLLITALIVASFIDLDLRILPDEITVGGMMLAPFLVLIAPEIHTRRVDGSVSWLVVRTSAALEGFSASLPAFLRQAPAVVLLVAAVAAVAFLGGIYGYRGYWRLTRRGEVRPLRHGLLAGVLSALCAGALVYGCVFPESLLAPPLYALWAAFGGMLVGSSLVFAVGVVGTKVFRKPAMGFGDVKLMGLLGAFTGWAGVITGFFIACFLGSIVGIFLLVRYRSRYLPFGPFLALGSLATVLWPEAIEQVFDWYLHLVAR